MNTKQLRQKILDLAIRGKLVPQDPNDEPASVLLERVRAEKEKLIKEGKIKRDKKDSTIFRGDDKLHYEKVPFEVPESWVWCRLDDICVDFQYGTSQKSDEYGMVAVLRMGNLQGGEVDYSDLVFTSDALDIEKYLLNPNELLFNRTNSPEWVGKTAIYRGDIPAIFAGYIIRVKPVFVDPLYLNYLMNSEYHRYICSKAKTDGVNQSNINAQKLSNFVYPIAPLTEQRRIVVAIESAFAVIDEIERNKTDLRETVTAARSKILSLAICGKLVQQDLNDEPASVLLECIRTEREALIKTGKIKRDKKDSIIKKSDDNSYYAGFPESWELCKISELCVLQNGKAFKPSDWSQKGLPIVRIQNLNDGNMPYNYFNGEIGKNHHLFGGELLFAWSGTPGTSFGAHIWGGGEAVLNQHIFRVDCFDGGITKEYFQHAINYRLNQLISVAHGGAGLQHVTKGVFENTQIPLPPLAEQQRIVATIKATFEQLDNIISTLI